MRCGIFTYNRLSAVKKFEEIVNSKSVEGIPIKSEERTDEMIKIIFSDEDEYIWLYNYTDWKFYRFDKIIVDVFTISRDEIKEKIYRQIDGEYYDITKYNSSHK